jgi:hypothetical protein
MDSVELIEAAPQSGLTQTFEDLSHIPARLLWGTVGDDDEDTEGSTHILDSLGFTGTGWTSGSTTKVHVQSLSQGDVTSIGQWSNTESLLSTKELVRVIDLPVGNLNTKMLSVLFPVHSALFLPVEVLNIGDLSKGLRE